MMAAEVEAGLERALHDLCQPLTALQGVLELGQIAGDPASLREAVDSGLGECARAFACVADLRRLLGERREPSGGAR